MAKQEEEIILKTKAEGTQETVKDLNKVEKATDDVKKATEEYEDTLGDLAKETEFFGISINKVSTAFRGSMKAVKGSVTSLKGFKTALISTGIGAFVVALGTLATAFTKTQQGINLVEDVTTSLSNVWSELIKRVGLAAQALLAFFDGDWDKATELATKTFKNFGGALADAAKAGVDLAQKVRDLDADKNKLIVSQAEELMQLEKLKNFSDNVTNALVERIVMTEKARDIIAKQGEENIKIAERERDLFAELNDLDNARPEILREYAELEAKVFTARQEQFAKDTEQMTKLNGLKKEYAEQEAKLEEELVKKKEKSAFDKLMLETEMLTNIAGIGNKYAQGVAILQNIEALRDAIKATLSAFSNTKGGIAAKISAAAIAATKAGVLVAALKSIKLPKLAADGMLVGNSHEQGGILIEAEGGEAIINKRSMAIPWVREQASYLNQIGGGVPFYARGGMVADTTTDPFIDLQKSIEAQRTVLVLDDLDTAQSNNAITVTSSTL